MKTFSKRLLSLPALGFVLAFGISEAAEPAAKPKTGSLGLPKIFQAAKPEERLGAIRVAELDATRLLMERIFGVSLNSKSSIYDLVLRSDEISTELNGSILGVSTTERPEYLEDGTVQVVRSVKLRQVLETITRTLKQKETERGTVTVSDMENVTRESKDTVVEVMGNGALPGSPGLRRIQAKRAAELDAYRKLAERLMGVSVTSTTTVKNLLLESDMLRAATAQFVKGAKPTAITYRDDGTCEIAMQIKVAEVFEVIRKYAKNRPVESELVKVEQEYSSHTFTETGFGAPPKPGAESQAVPGAAGADARGVFRETEVIIRRLIGEKIVVD